MRRPTDHAWEALVVATNANPSADRGAVNRSLAMIREQMPDLDNQELGREITYRAVLYRDVWPEIALTPTALAKHWERVPVEHARNRTHATNRTATATDCPTCGGDRFVPVYEPDGHEAYARCPACNAGSR